MLITQLKSKEDITSLLDKRRAAIINCTGCSEVYFPETQVAEICNELSKSGNTTAVICTDYICSPDNFPLQIEMHSAGIYESDILLVFSCGVGVQAVSGIFTDKQVFAGCDTYPLPGFQGVTPLEYDCALCGECHLNDTYGICPITSCSKGLINGQCGGSKNGMCEADDKQECGWERIYKREKKKHEYN